MEGGPAVVSGRVAGVGVDGDWWLVWGGVKLGLDAWEAVLGLVRRGGRGEPSGLARQLRWGVPGTAREHLEAYWRGQGVEPPQEVALLHELGAQEGWRLLRASPVVILIAVVGGLLGLLVPQVRHYSWAWGLALPALIYWPLRPAVWRTWLAYLYGVDTWDLRPLMALCLGLGMSAPADLASALETDGK